MLSAAKAIKELACQILLINERYGLHLPDGESLQMEQAARHFSSTS
jgi:hypothetical protein